MTSRRVQKAAQAIREVVSMSILADLTDPRIQGVTVTYVEVSGDMRKATVHVSVMGDQSQQDLTLHGLRSSAGYLQQKVSKRIDTRYTPRIEFELDMGIKKSIEISEILKDILPDEPERDAPEREAAEATESQPMVGQREDVEDLSLPPAPESP